MTRLVGRFARNGETLVGEVASDRVTVLSSVDELPAQLSGRAVANGRPVARLEELEWQSPLHPAARVLAVALNYAGHARETGSIPPERPLFFYKPASSFVGHTGTLDSHPELTREFDYEGEVGVVIGRPCTAVSASEALEFVAGIVAIDDGSARDRLRIPAGDTAMFDWIGCKALDRSSAIGPAVATGPEIVEALSARTVEVKTRVNGRVVQEGRTDDLIFPVEQLVAEASAHMTLMPGDVIATGTPAGVGHASGTYLQPGDSLAVEVSFLPPLEVEVG